MIVQKNNLIISPLRQEQIAPVPRHKTWLKEFGWIIDIGLVVGEVLTDLVAGILAAPSGGLSLAASSGIALGFSAAQEGFDQARGTASGLKSGLNWGLTAFSIGLGALSNFRTSTPANKWKVADKQLARHTEDLGMRLSEEYTPFNPGAYQKWWDTNVPISTGLKKQSFLSRINRPILEIERAFKSSATTVKKNNIKGRY